MSADSDVRDLFRRAADEFGKRVHAVRDDQWQAPTPCSEWDVRALVHHLVYELRWAPPLFAGATIAEVGDRFEGDLLGADPKAAWDGAAREAVAAVQAAGAMERTVHLSFGDVPGSEYARQLLADLLIHGWDLARAIGAEERLDPALVDACATWFAQVEDAYRGTGAIGPRAELPDDADAQARLLAAFGRDPAQRA
jgi:uncharacterized protein (TIGR03086 family)